MRYRTLRAKFAKYEGVKDIATDLHILSYLSGLESKIAFLDFSRVDLELSCPTLNEILLENCQTARHGQGLELSIVVQVDAELDGYVTDFGKLCLRVGDVCGQVASDVHSLFHVRNLHK